MNREIQRIILLCIPLLLMAVNGYTQTTPDEIIVRGFLSDAETGLPLPYGHVRVEGRFQGALANDAGFFELHLNELPAEISVSFIGYHTESLVIDSATDDTLAIALTPSPVVLEEIVVTPEDPAVAIMREVIRRKQEWRAGLDTWHADAYTRVTLSNEEKIATIMESISDVFWRNGHGVKEVVQSKRQTANFDDENNFAQARTVPNLYDDDIDIMGFDIIGLTHPDALDYYEFTLIGRRMRDNALVYDIRAVPKKKLQPSFVGTLSVLDGEFAVLDMAVKPNEAVMFPAPLNDIATAYEQQFDNFGGDYWLPVNVTMDAQIKLGIPGLRFPAIKYRQLTHLSEYEINTAVPDSLFPDTKRETTVTVNLSNNSASVTLSERDTPSEDIDGESRERRQQRSDTARQEADSDSEKDTPGRTAEEISREAARIDSIFTENPLVIPFTEAETQAYTEIDSTDTIQQAFRPTGFLTRLADDNDEPEKPSEPPSAFSQAINRITEPFGVSAAYNRVDGLSGGLSFEKWLYDVEVNLYGQYRAEPERWAYGGGLRYQFGPGSRAFVSAEYSAGTERQYGESVYFGWLNSLSTILGRNDYFDYYDNRSFRLQGGYQFRRTGIELEGGIRLEEHDTCSLATSYNLFNRNINQRPNPPAAAGRLRSVELTLGYGEGPEGMGLIGGNRIELRIEHSSPDILDSGFDFTCAEIVIDGRIETFLRRRLFANTLDIKVIGGVSSGDVPPQRYGSIDGAFGVFAPFGVMRTLRNRQMAGDRYAAVFWEHNFRTAPFELIGLYPVARRGIGVIMHGASAKTWREGSTVFGISGGEEERHEIGLSLNGLFTLLRIDVTKRLDRDDWFGGFGVARMF